jgi:hypothetical protein
MPITLPPVLAGPIVRRVEPRLFTVWIALSEPASGTDSVEVKIWRGFQMSGPAAGAVVSGDPLVASGSAPTRPFGKHLHIACVVVKIVAPSPPLDHGTIYSYDVTIKRSTGNQGLKSLGMLSDQPAPPPPADTPPAVALGYATDRLPTFCTPPASIDKVRIVHGSCRRSNSSGFDALAFLDDALADNLTNPDERPQQLMLTGDQIYADDLGAGMLLMVNALANAIMGADEMIRVNDAQIPVLLENFPAERRLKFVQETAGFTTTDGDNHLLSFGELAAMYLTHWNPRIWIPLGMPDKVFVPFAGDERLRALLSYPEGKFAEPDAFKEMPGPDGKPQKIFGAPGTNQTHVNQARQKWLEDRTKEHGGFTNEQTNTVIFRHGVPRVARALANVATYMIADDHEVTDDWNLNQKWRNRVYSTKTGKDIIRNGVAAFGVFQGWGNDPVKFDTGNNKDFLDTTSALFTGDGPYPAGPLDRIEELTAVLVTPKLDKQPVWHYQTVGPRHVIAVMDSRTRRKFTGQDYTPPDLIGNNRDEQIPKGPFTDEHELVFIVAPAPVFGPDVIESLGWPLAILLTDVKRRGAGAAGSGPIKKEAGTEKFDNEGWASNPQAREDFLKRLSTFPRAVILSGDVHYGCSLSIDYWKKGQATPVRIAQLTSSGTRNNFKPIVAAIVRTNAMLQLFLSDVSAEQLAWHAPPPISIPTGAFVSPGRLARLGRSPVLVPAAGWPNGTTLPATAEPDWSWRAAMIRDTRPDTELPTARRPLNLSPSQELVATAAIPTYQAIAARHAQAAATNFDHRRQIVFVPNIGLVKLWKKGAELMVTHTLVTAETRDAIVGSANTVHDISLAPSTEPAPTIVTRDA